MGLAEISKNNPLKVIHSQLEYDENETKVAFIGISNWTLDASKMNRGIHLSIPEPDLEDLKFTAKTIVESYDNFLLTEYGSLFEKLAISYYNYKEFLKELGFNNKNNTQYYDFHGSRDFYHLIKITAKKILKYKRENRYINKEDLVLESIERNFGGLDFSVQEFKKIFLETNEVSDKYDIKKNLIENINDNTSRYILIITKSSISQFLIDTILNELKKNYIFFFGSRFEDDINKEEYSSKNIHKIQICMEQGFITVFKNLESIYPSLYDLFNQNFLIQYNKKFARIAIGYSNNKPYEVNDNFKSIIIIEQNDIKKQDPPFLNRFEKYLFSFEILLNEELIKKSKTFEEMIKYLITKSDEKKTVINLEKQLICCGLEEIQGLIYQLNKKGKQNNELLDEVFKKISKLFSQDILAYAYKKIIIKNILMYFKKLNRIILNQYTQN